MNETASRAVFEAHVNKLTPRLLGLRHWTVYEKTFPILDVGFESDGRPGFRLRLICRDWNERPPSIQLLALDGESLIKVPQDSTSIINRSAHPITGRPFICMPSSLEYHIHTSHTTDHWDNYKTKSDYDLGGILTKIWRAWRKSKDE